MPNTIHVRKESVINNLLRNKKKSDFTILFHSTWSDDSKKIVEMAEEWTEKEPEGSTPIHTVSSWDVPHGFVIFKITKTPALVTCTKGKIRVTDYYPHLCGFFDRSKKGTR